MSMRKCPFTYCNNPVTGSNFCCPSHWTGLAGSHRQRAYHVFMQYVEKSITQSQLLDAQKRIAQDAEMDCEIEDRAGIQLGNRCQKCKAEICTPYFKCGSTAEKIALDPEHAGLTGEYVIVGGYAYTGLNAQIMRDQAPALALLRRHVCGVERGSSNGGHTRTAGKIARQRGRASDPLRDTEGSQNDVRRTG